MKKLFFSAFLALLFVSSMSAQRDETLFNRSGFKFSGAWGATTIGVDGFDANPGITSGGFGGLEFGKSVFIGWGGYALDKSLTVNNEVKDIDLDYNGLMVGFAPKAHKVLHPQLNLLAGGGSLRVEDEGRDRSILVLRPSAGIEVNVFRWFRVGAEAGYRYVANTDFEGLSDSDFSNAYGQLTFKFGWSWGRAKGERRFKFRD